MPGRCDAGRDGSLYGAAKSCSRGVCDTGGVASIDTFATVVELGRAYRRGDAEPQAVIAAHLDRIDALDPTLNAFVVIDRDGALEAAQRSAARYEAGAPIGPLDGVPVTIKDIVAMAGHPTRSGSTTTSPEPATTDTPSVARLREAGAIMIGKTTTPEFGWKGMTDSPLTGVTRNPWNPAHTPGGSSGGAAASLAAGIGTIAHGSDGGGSIRIPASYCGLVGIKPTFGRVPQHPTDSPFVLSVSNGPIARTVSDAAIFLNEVCRPDTRDPWAIPYDGRDWRVGLDDGVRGLRIAVTTRLGGVDAIDVEVIAAWRSTVDALSDLGAKIVEVTDVFDPLRPEFEAHWKAGFANTLRAVPRDRWQECDPGFLALAREGLDVSLAAFGEAMAARSRLIAGLASFHLDHDVLITPTMPTLPPRTDTVYHSADFDRWQHAVPYTVPFNLTGQPAASMPVAVSESGLPIGIQVIAARFREDLVLRTARVIESAMGFTQPHPLLRSTIDTWHQT